MELAVQNNQQFQNSAGQKILTMQESQPSGVFQGAHIFGASQKTHLFGAPHDAPLGVQSSGTFPCARALPSQAFLLFFKSQYCFTC